MSHQLRENIKKFIKISIFSGLASFLTMITVQYFMGGIRDVGDVLVKSLLIGFGLALSVLIIPKRENKYPWQ